MNAKLWKKHRMQEDAWEADLKREQNEQLQHQKTFEQMQMFSNVINQNNPQHIFNYDEWISKYNQIQINKKNNTQ